MNVDRNQDLFSANAQLLAYSSRSKCHQHTKNSERVKPTMFVEERIQTRITYILTTHTQQHNNTVPQNKLSIVRLIHEALTSNSFQIA